MAGGRVFEIRCDVAARVVDARAIPDRAARELAEARKAQDMMILIEANAAALEGAIAARLSAMDGAGGPAVVELASGGREPCLSGRVSLAGDGAGRGLPPVIGAEVAVAVGEEIARFVADRARAVGRFQPVITAVCEEPAQAPAGGRTASPGEAAGRSGWGAAWIVMAVVLIGLAAIWYLLATR